MDPIQFRPYDPSTENRAIDVPDITSGFRENTQRIAKDMQSANQQEQANDAIRKANAAVYGQSLADLGSLSASLTNLLQKGVEAKIDADKTAAANDALLGDTPISEEFETEEAAVIAEGDVERPALEQVEDEGTISPTTTRTYRQGSIWYRWERAKLDVQSKTADMGAWIASNRYTEVTIGGKKMSLDTAETPAELSAVKTALTQRYVKENGLGEYRDDLLGKYGRKNIQQAWTTYTRQWSEEKATQIKTERANEDAVSVGGSIKGGETAQDILARFPKTPAGRFRMANAIKLAVKQGIITPEEGAALLEQEVTTPAGTKPLSEMFPGEFGGLPEQLQQESNEQRGRDLQGVRLNRDEARIQAQQDVAALAADGKYLSPEDEQALADRLWEEHQIPKEDTLRWVTNSREQSQDLADTQAEAFMDNDEEVPKDIYDRASPEMQEIIRDSGKAPDTSFLPPQSVLKPANKYIGALVVEKLGETGLPMESQSPIVLRTSERLRSIYTSKYQEGMRMFNDPVEADKYAKTAIQDIVAELPTLENTDALKTNPYTRPYSGDGAQELEQRTQKFSVLRDDPDKLNQPDNGLFTPEELEEGKKAIESGGPIPWVFRYASGYYPKGTARQLLERQLGLAGIEYTPHERSVLADGVVEATPEDLQPLLTWRPTPARASRVSMDAQGYTPDSPEMMLPAIADRADIPFDIKQPTRGAQAIMVLGDVPKRGAAFLAGNIQQESAWNGQRDWGEVAGDGTSRNGGLVSWASWSDDPARLGKIERYLGKDISKASDQEQIQAMLWEMKTYYPGAYRVFMDPNSTDQELIQASKQYWGYRDEGARYQYSQNILRGLG